MAINEAGSSTDSGQSMAEKIKELERENASLAHDIKELEGHIESVEDELENARLAARDAEEKAEQLEDALDEIEHARPDIHPAILGQLAETVGGEIVDVKLGHDGKVVVVVQKPAYAHEIVCNVSSIEMRPK